MKSESRYSSKVKSTEGGEDVLMSRLRRMGEIALMNHLAKFPKPTASGNKIPLSKNQAKIYDKFCRYATGFFDSMEGMRERVEAELVTKLREGDYAFFKIATQALEDVKNMSIEKLDAVTAHAIMALQAKLEIEQSIGMLPSKKQVKERAFALAKYVFRDADFSPWEPEAKQWAKALKLASLGYLDGAKRGKNRR